MLDIGLLRKAVEWVEYQAALPAFESEWYQAEWRQGWTKAQERRCEHKCGTTYCLAGYISEITGGQWASGNPRSSLKDYLVPESDEEVVDYFGNGRRVVTAESRALRKLGLNRGDQYNLFAAYQTAPGIRRIAERIAADHGETL